MECECVDHGFHGTGHLNSSSSSVACFAVANTPRPNLMWRGGKGCIPLYFIDPFYIKVYYTQFSFANTNSTVPV